MLKRFSSRGWVAGILILAALTANGVVAGQADRDYIQGLWVWPDSGPSNEVTDPALRKLLVNRSAASDVDVLYVSVYRSPPNESGRLMQPDAYLADLIARAHDRDLEVWAAYGNYDWPAIGCDASGFPRQRMREIVEYNRDNPEAKFDGVMLDIGPPEPPDFIALLSLYQCVLEGDLRPNGLKMGAAIRFFWDAPVIYPPLTGVEKAAHQHIIDLELDQVVVMGYRDYAGKNCSDNGVVCLVQDEVEYASRQGKDGLVLAGLETQDCGASGACVERATFYEEGQKTMNREARRVVRRLRRSAGFGGFGVHYYGDAYLSGQPSWPKVNRRFP